MVWIANFGAAMFQIDIVLKLTAAALQFGNHAFELRNPSLALVEAESLFGESDYPKISRRRALRDFAAWQTLMHHFGAKASYFATNPISAYLRGRIRAEPRIRPLKDSQFNCLLRRGRCAMWSTAQSALSTIAPARH